MLLKLEGICAFRQLVVSIGGMLMYVRGVDSKLGISIRKSLELQYMECILHVINFLCCEVPLMDQSVVVTK